MYYFHQYGPKWLALTLHLQQKLINKGCWIRIIVGSDSLHPQVLATSKQGLKYRFVLKFQSPTGMSLHGFSTMLWWHQHIRACFNAFYVYNSLPLNLFTIEYKSITIRKSTELKSKSSAMAQDDCKCLPICFNVLVNGLYISFS